MARHTNFLSPNLAKLSPPDLVKACAASNDEQSWAEFVRRFHSVIAASVLRTARRWCEPTPAAQLDDLIQETYLKLCENNSRLLAMFRSHRDDSIYAFLKVVTANVVHDHFKSEHAGKRDIDQTDPIRAVAEIDRKTSSDHAFDAGAIQRLQLDHIDEILRRVTSGRDQARNRAIFWLHHRQGFTAGEIASIPSIGLATEGVESVLMRLAIMIRGQLTSSSSHREVKVLKRQNRSKKLEA